MILDRIVADTREALSQRRKVVTEGTLLEQLASAPVPIDFVGAVRRQGVSVIAEIKRASPSKGAMAPDLQPSKLSVTYADHGADAISVLTEPLHFRGSLEDLREVRQSLAGRQPGMPLLRKDFIIDTYQLLEARVCGADAILLIAAILEDTILRHLFDEALELALTPLVEVHNGPELARVLPLSPPVVGINNRNLKDFSVDLNTTRQLRPLLPPSCTVVSESGISTPEQVRELAALGVDAVLVGEALVKATNPGVALRTLKAAGQ